MPFPIRGLVTVLAGVCLILVGSTVTAYAWPTPHSGPMRRSQEKRERPPSGIHWTDPDERFSLTFPADWTMLDPPPAGTVVTSISDPETPDDSFMENVNVVLETIPAGYSQDDYLIAIRENMAFVDNYQEHARGPWVRDGHPGIWIEYSADFLTDQTSHNLVFVTTEPDLGIVITCSSVEVEFDRWKVQLRQIAESFRFE